MLTENLPIHNKKFRQRLTITIKSENHDSCLEISKILKKQCDAWFFSVKHKEHKSARKGSVLSRELMIYQEAYSDDSIIFKEAIRRICLHLNRISKCEITFTDSGSIPIDKY